MELKLIPIDKFLGKDYLNFPIPNEQETLKNFQEHLDTYKKAYTIAYNKQESEEHFKGLFNDFIKKSFSYTVNTHERIDSCIFDKDGAINTLIEVKRPFNTNEMITEGSPNKKAFHEALLYFYEQSQNTSLFVNINNIFITDCQSLYLFKASSFKTLIEDKNLSKILRGFRDKSLDLIKTTGDLYNALAPACENICIEGFKIDLFSDTLDLKILYKLLEKHYLFRLPLENDANALNKEFYNELLYIMGLEENSKDHTLGKSKNKNTLLDLTQAMLKSNIPDKEVFETALGLNILWLNRILFLKILESQLQIFRDDAAFTILSPGKIKGYHLLSKLFFNILSTPREDRHEDDKKPYELIPYLNSSLFEKTELEKTYGIDKLDAEHLIPIMPGSVLYNDKIFAKKELTLLEYLLRFLNCFHFNNDAESEDNNTVIKSSVLGLVFEKLNGYRDGSHFTPAAITMYMARQTIRQQVLYKFNQEFGIDARSLDELINFTSKFYKAEDIEKAHHIIDGISIIDPAVGSGHFLVSCLNELIVIKGQLGLLHRGVRAECVNDELILKNSYGDKFLYQLQNKAITPEKQEIQKAVFDTKKHIIENQLYGIDINPNSVNICRLRLWIELLKHTYYTDSHYIDCEVLPNLEFKIMTANSLLPLKEDNLFFGAAEKQSLRTKMKEYYNAVRSEKQDIKNEVISLIETYKKDTANPQLEDYRPFDTMKVNSFFDSGFMFGTDNFDIVIMNPPYFALQSLAKSNNPYQGAFDTYRNTGDIYQLFLEHAFKLLKDTGIVSAVVSNKWMRAGYGESTRLWLHDKAFVHEVIDLGAHWFDSATVDTNIISYQKRRGKAKQNLIPAYTLSNAAKDIEAAKGMDARSATAGKDADAVAKQALAQSTSIAPDEKGGAWLVLTDMERRILDKMQAAGKPLKDWDVTINRGVLTGLNEAFIIDGAAKGALIAEDAKSAEIIKPLLRGRDIKRYGVEFADKWLINTHNGLKEKNIPPIDINNYPAIKKHLDAYYPTLEKRLDKGETPYNLRNCAYLEDFEKPKIVYGEIAMETRFYLDTDSYYPEATSFLMTGSSLRYLLAVINSRLINYAFKKFFSIALFGGASEAQERVRFKKVAMDPLPIPVPTKAIEAQIGGLVDEILQAKKDNETTAGFGRPPAVHGGAGTADIPVLEAEIDNIVYRLYGLDEDEIRTIEA